MRYANGAIGVVVALSCEVLACKDPPKEAPSIDASPAPKNATSASASSASAPSASASSPPTNAPIGWVDVALGGLASDPFGCAVDERGEVACWGNPTGANASIFGETPTKSASGLYKIAGAKDVATIGFVSTNPTACAKTRSRTGICWGANANGELGRGSKERSSPVPLPVHDLSYVREIVGQSQMVCALIDGGGIWCWGRFPWRDKPYDVPEKMTGFPAKTLVGQRGGFCTVLEGGGVECWGDHFATPAPATPSKLKILSNVVSLGAHQKNCACGLDAAGTLVCANCSATFPKAWPANLASPPDRGGQLSCALTKDAQVRCMMDDDTATGPLPELAGATKIVMGQDTFDKRVCALMADKRICCKNVPAGMPGTRSGDATCLPPP
jgi:hypothetical protein